MSPIATNRIAEDDVKSDSPILGDSIEMLLISGRNLLTREQEVSLATQIQNGCFRSKNELVESNSRLVLSIAKRYEGIARGKGIDLADLVQEGNLGLIRAAEKFDPKKGFAFSTYATHFIRKCILRCIEQNRLIKTTNTAREVAAKIKETTENFYEENNRSPSLDELSSIMGMPKESLMTYQASTKEIGSLDDPVKGGDDHSAIVGDFVSDPDSLSAYEEILEKESGSPLILAMNSLHPDYRDILEATFGFYPQGPLSYSECAVLFGISTEQARQRQRLALRALKSRLEGSSRSYSKSDEVWK